MKILIVGGTSFAGRAISWSAWHHGHDVTIINRGITPSDLPEKVERLVGDRQSDLSALNGRSFDATIDVTAYWPRDVKRLADALGERGGHYVQISSVSAYREADLEGGTEATLTLWDEEGVDLDGPLTGTTYGPLKAASERAGTTYFGTNATFVRPTYVIGSHDNTWRFPYWVERARRGGVIAVPGPRSAPMQYIDARDLANFAVRVTEDRLVGAFHTAGPEPGDHYVEMIEQVVAQVAPSGTTIHVVEPERVVTAGLEAKFPLWSGGGHAANLTVNSRLALANGLDLRPLGDSVDDVIDWWANRAWPDHWLTSDEEATVLS